MWSLSQIIVKVISTKKRRFKILINMRNNLKKILAKYLITFCIYFYLLSAIQKR